MRLGKEALGIGALVMALGGGCDGQSGRDDGDVTLVGMPISVAVNRTGLATVLQVNGAPILAYARNGSSLDDLQAAALIQAEITDGDDETIELKGRYENDGITFVIESLTANGYTIEF